MLVVVVVVVHSGDCHRYQLLLTATSASCSLHQSPGRNVGDMLIAWESIEIVSQGIRDVDGLTLAEVL